MNSIYLGVDVAGKGNTWVAGLSLEHSSLVVTIAPHLCSLCQVAQICNQRDVVAVAIDAQLTMSLSEEDGFRASDEELRKRLPSGCRNWVASINSLRAVPIRGWLLGDSLGSIVGTLLETHPRASLHFALGKTAGKAIHSYKKVPDAEKHTSELWQRWSNRFGITSDAPVRNDGELDSLVCATVAYLYHREPQMLLKLKYEVPHIRGRGPFYVVAPD
jgi:predicted nuclease with RNAse H fold